MPSFDKTLFKYTSLFCEENIWKLIETLNQDTSIKPVDTLFILNQTNTVALFNQEKALNNTPVIWDYHVILSAEIDNELFIFDFDSHCDFPVSIREYFNKTFIQEDKLKQQYRPLLKVIDAFYYLNHFSSDRSHMLGIIPESEFPDYTIIQPKQHSALTLESCRKIPSTQCNQEILTTMNYLNKALPKR